MNKPEPSLRDAAFALARAGWRIFPLKPGQKEPLIAEWQLLATSNLATVERWWTQHPDANIGIHCGNGTLGFDVDVKKGKNGPASLAALEGQHGKVPETLTARTPSGGQHRYLAGPNVTNSAGKLGEGLDIRSEGGFLVAPPSRIGAGVYEWVNPAQPIMPAPQWLLDRLQPQVEHVERDIETEITPEQLADLRSALAHPALLEWAGGNEEWSSIGYALLSLGEVGRELWLDFSQRAPNYDSGAPEAWWAKRRKPRSDYRSIFKRAAALGWKNPNPGGSIDPASVGFGKGPAPEGMSLSPIKPKESPAAPVLLAQGAPAKIILTHIADVLDRKSTAQWLPGLRNILEASVLAMLVAPRNTFKSFIVLEWAMRAAVEHCGVVILSGEGAGLDRRVDAWLRKHGKGIDPKALHVVTLERPVDLNIDGTLVLVRDAIAALGWPVHLIVVDTLSKFTPNVKENDNTENAQLLAKLSDALRYQFGASVLMVAHAGHAEPGRPRGASARMANPDAEYVVDRIDMRVSVTRERFKDSPSLPPLDYQAEVIDLHRLDDDGQPVTSLALVPSTTTLADVKADAKRKPQGPNEEAAHAAVIELAGSAPPAAVAFEDALRAAVERIPRAEGKEDRRRETVRRALGSLIERKVLRGVMGEWVGPGNPPASPSIVFAKSIASGGTGDDGGAPTLASGRAVPSVEEQEARRRRLNPTGVTLPPERDR